MKHPKVLFYDIETSPIIAYVWNLFDQNIALNQIKQDWNILSYSAKWLGSPKIIYEDLRKSKNVHDDSALCKGLWQLLDEADIAVSQNGIGFDNKKAKARFILNGMAPPSSFKNIDTLKLARKHFGFTSNKLEYLSDKLCTKYKKLKHKEFPGLELWKGCLSGNLSAWKEMEKYNKHDVLALEEVYTRLIPWDSSINFNLYSDDVENVCKCGSKEFQRNGFFYTSVGKFQRFRCTRCGSESKDRTNQLSKLKKASLRNGG